MSDFYLGAALAVMLCIALGLVRVIRGPGDAERMMAAQLLGTGGVATLLLLAESTGVSAVVDVALSLALLAAFGAIAFYRGTRGQPPADTDEPS